MNSPRPRRRATPAADRRETLPIRPEKPPEAAIEPVDFRTARGRHTRQHDARDACKMALGIGKRQSRAPGTAEHAPALDAEQRAQLFDVAHQMRRRIARHVARKVARMRQAVAAPALVELVEAPEAGIETAPDAGRRPRSRPAMQQHNRLAARVAAGRPRDAIAVAAIKKTVGVGGRDGPEPGHSAAQ